MAGRHHISPNALKHPPLGRAHLHPHPILIDDPRLLHRSSIPSGPARHLPAVVEERIAAQHREIQSLLNDNQRLSTTHVALKQELAGTEQELRHISAVAAKDKAERDAQVREVYERSLKMETEVRSIDAMNAELSHVKADIQKLNAARQELTIELKTIDGDLARARSESQQLLEVKAEIENMHQELQRGRAAVEFEKKTTAHNLEQKRTLEKNMNYMVHQVEKLRAELANAEKRARAAAAAAAAANPGPGYTSSYGNPDIGYGGNPYPDHYGMHQGGVGGDGVRQYGSGPMGHVPYDMQRPNVHT